MQARQSGFTLIELIMVIVILGALAVIALPRYIDLQSEANQAATEGVAGALSAAGAINYAAALAGSTDATSVENCTDVGPLLVGGLPSADYSIADLAIGTSTGDTEDCTLNGPNSSTAEFVGYRVD